MMPESDLERFAGLLREASRILIFTGAGVSTHSGIPDFRGPGGVWTRRQPIYYEQFMASEEARVEHWDYKLESWESFRQARPTATHRAVVDIERAGKLEMLVTQNIDGLHTLAGSSRERMVEIHGTNSEVECQTCQARFDPEPHFEFFREKRATPRCPSCAGFLKPATISFGQALREDDLTRAFAAAREADLAIALGSTLSVYPAAGVPLAAAERGAPYVVVNRGETEHDAQPALTLRIEGDVDEIFPAVVSQL